MDAVLNNLGSIACPEGDNCKKASCPLQHNREKRRAGAGLDGSEDGSRDQDSSRKRLKLSPDASELKQTNIEIPTAKKPVSPPPLRRNLNHTPRPSPSASSPATKSSVNSASKTLPQTTSTPLKTSSAATTILTLPAPAVTKPPAPRKIEALNPRHLNSTAPAPHDFRYKALNMLHDQYTRLNNELKKDAKDDEKNLVLSVQELIWKALDDEEKLATEKASIYENIIKNRIMHYKRMTPGQWRDERLTEYKKKVAASTPKRPPSRLKPGVAKEIITGLTPQQEVTLLSRLFTPITELSSYNYVPTLPTDEAIAKARAGQEASLGWEKCDRCQTRFQVFPGRREEDGALTTGGKCTYHWGKLWYPERAASDNVNKKKYKCCGQAAGQSSGCITGESHVFKAGAPARLAALVPFMETPPNPTVPKDRAVCFDCEMGYTVHGLELLRLTATSWPDGKVLLDVLVYPVGEIIDLNSRYSGVWPEDLVSAVPWTEDVDYEALAADEDQEYGEIKDAKPQSQKHRKRLPVVPSPVIARDLLFKLIAPDTPLIGHGLENDLNALRVIHPTLIDTVLLFPHRAGLPVRQGLKQLMANHLNKIIQADPEPGSEILGHDSAEDARAAGELVRYRLMMEWRRLQRFGWKLVDGKFVPPEGTASLEEAEEERMKKVEEDRKRNKEDGQVEEKAKYDPAMVQVEKKPGGLGVGLGSILSEAFLEN
ncbi:hypothetical protein V8F33_010927 [Rhypophila sp. PSN 637]